MYGPYLALGTAFCWTISAVAFEEASKRVGSVPVNLLRLIVAFLLLMAFNALRLGEALPGNATAFQWNYLLVSGVLGFFVGDLALFRAFVLLGARLSTLMMCLAPPIAAVTEWVWIGGRITPLQIAGMIVTLVGVAWVVYEKPAIPPPATEADNPETAGHVFESEARLAGASTTVIELDALPAVNVRHVTPFAIFLGVMAAAGQGVGLVCTKIGMTAEPKIDPFAATQIRIVAGIVTFLGLVLVTRRLRDCGRTLVNGPAMGLLLIGSITGPFLGVSLLNKSVELIPSGVAQTITSLVPVLIIPLSVWLFKERVSPRAVFGAIVAVIGVGMLVL